MSFSNILDFNTLVANQVAAQQAAADQVLDYTPGSVLLAVAEANASVAIWLQSLFINLLATTRASSSNESALDTFVGDFGITRLPAVAATGQSTFSRISSTQQAIIYPGATIQSADGAESFAVTLDITNSAYNSGVGGYVLPIGTASAILPIVAAVAGLGGNVAAGTITVITTPIPNIDTVTNAVALINGEDPESDTALRARFTAFIASRSKATLAAVNYAIQGQQQGLTQSINENMQLDGITDKGFFHAVVDDGSGEPSTDLLTSVYSAVDAVRPLTVSFAVFGPTTVNINIALKLTIVPGYGVTDVKTAVQAAIVNYVNGLGVGVSMQYSKIAQLAYTTSDGVANVANVLLNGGIIDVVAAPNQLFKTSSTLVVVS